VFEEEHREGEMFSTTFKVSAILVAASMLNSVTLNSAMGQDARQVAPQGHRGSQYPQLHAPLYPSPVQNTPSWNGGTIITNQGFVT